MKKAQGISINVVIIAAIALLVLVVLSVILLGKMGPVARDDCAKQDKTICQPAPCGEGYVRSLTLKCYDADKPSATNVCCQKLG